MDFTEIETYLAVADSLNLTKAADHLFTSQSTVTHRLNRLEDELQYKLFTRKKGKRTVELTIRGEEFMSLAQRWIALHQEMELLKHSYSKTLSVASIDSVNVMMLPAVLKEISKKEYGVNVKIQTHHTPEIYDLVKRREADIGFVSSDSYHEEIITQPVFKQKFVLIRPCANPQGRKKVHPSELDPSAELFQSWGYDYLKWHSYWWPTTVSPHIKIDSVTALCNFLDDEQYWAIVQLSSLKTILKNRSIQVYDIIEPPPDWICYKIMHKYPDSKNAAGIRVFNQIFERFLSDTDLFKDDI
ncbi:MAG: hypothetical protein K0R23_3231 [Lacrimispora sp.]|nr:hypothetical protein [Lacrimispora sp.]